MAPSMSLFHGWDQLPWPGNVRQLEHAISYTLIMGEPPNWLGRQGQAMPRPSEAFSQAEHPLSRWLGDGNENDRFRSALLKFESDLLRETIQRFPTRIKTAEWLGLTKQELHYRLKKNGLV
jgi:DNA-binding NtrC family response regulator